jgi:hypothetical protein
MNRGTGELAPSTLPDPIETTLPERRKSIVPSPINPMRRDFSLHGAKVEVSTRTRLGVRPPSDPSVMSYCADRSLPDRR